MKYYQLTLTAALLWNLAGCNPAPETDPIAEAENLMEVSRAWAREAQQGNVDQIISYWDEDAVLMMPGMADLKGHEGLRQMVEASSGMPGFEIDWEPVEARVSASGDMGYVVASKFYTMPDSLGQQVKIFVREVTIWEKKPDGSWKNTIDIYNRDPSITAIR